MKQITLFLYLCLGAAAWGQSGPTGGLSGTVTDPSGQRIPAAKIDIRNASTGFNREVEANVDGDWEARTLPTGKYTVTIEAGGFQKLVMSEVAVEAAVVTTLPALLSIGTVNEAVTVVGEVPLVTSNTSATSRQIDTRELLQVPTATRSFTHLLSAEMGVSADLPPVLVNGNGNISPSVNGLRTTSNSVQFNGIDATSLSSNEGSLTDNISPAPETLEEVKLQTSMYDASVGRSGGGNFQLITRSGTNEIHGSAYYFGQNEAFNANDYFYNRDGIDRPRARRQEGGFTVGGPVKKDKIFFFGGYQRTQADTGFVPTAQSLSHLPVALDQITGERTAANLFQAFRSTNPNFSLTSPSQIDPIALKLFNLRNPETGQYIISGPAGKAFAGSSRTDGAGNPLMLVRQVFPARFEQDQFNLKSDVQLSALNRLSGTLFFANYPGFDPFPDPSSLSSPFTLKRNDHARTLSITDIHTFGATVTNEARFGMHLLDNTRLLDPKFDELTNDAVGVPNPASQFDSSIATRRLGHYTFRGPRFSFGGPNDAYNLRDQKSFSVSDTISIFRGKHSLRIGGEWKRHLYNTYLPEEQATEFEKFSSFDQLLGGYAQEADTQYGFTNKQFGMTDLSWFVSDDWKLTQNLTLNIGIRWDWFGWPVEKNGLLGNFDFARMTDTENPLSGFIVPSNVGTTPFAAINSAIAASTPVDTKHTLNGQDLNNFQPRIGFSYSPLKSGRMVIRGGYGFFYDRPSAAFMNTVFSNYPFLREIEVTFPSARVPLGSAFSAQDTSLGFDRFLPVRVVHTGGSGGNFQLRDNTGVTVGADGSPNPIDPSTGRPFLGNIAETFEFRAVDRNMRTPYIQQWNFGVQHEVAQDLMLEVRYVGTKGTKLLQAAAFNQGYDLNDASTPDYVYQRLNQAYVSAGSPRGPLNQGATAREQGLGRAFGFIDPLTGQANLNFGAPPSSPTSSVMIPFEARAPILGFNIPEAILMQSSANSIYNSAQVGFTRRFSKGLQFRGAYTLSKTIDSFSSDPGSTSGGGRPDVPNTGFVSQGDQRNLRANRGLADFDRPHRFSLSYSYTIPSFGSKSRWAQGWQFSGFAQLQSGAPYSIWFPEPEAASPAALASLGNGSGGLYRLGFGRPNLAPGYTLDQLRESGADPTRAYFNSSALSSPGGGFGNLGRNVLRGPKQTRFDMAISKETSLTERFKLEIRMEAFNVFNNVNFALPVNDLSDSEFGQITNTVGGPRTMQFGARFRF